MQDVNNLEKIGFDGQETALDKLLGEYFLQKRGQYVANNELLD